MVLGQLVPRGSRQTNNRMLVKNQSASLRILGTGLAGLYFVYAGYLIYIILEGFQAARQPNTIVPELIPTSVILAGFAAFWVALGLFQLQGHHHQNIAGSVLSMTILFAASIFQDATIGLAEGEALLVIVATAMLGLIDLRVLPERRAFPAVMSVDALLLISFSLMAKYPGSLSLLGAVLGTVGVLGGAGMLVFGLFRLIRPTKLADAQVLQ